MINIRIPMILILMLALMACGSGSGDGSGDGSGTDNVGSSGSGSPVEVSLERLSDAEFNALTEEEKFAVSNKALGALFKGVAPDEFFDLTNGVFALVLKTDQNYVSQIENDLSKTVNESQYRNLITQKYEFDENQEPLQYPLALLYEVPLSKNYFEIWMAYQLTNTILFSPAVELDTVAYEDARIVFDRLLNMIRQGIHQIT